MPHGIVGVSKQDVTPGSAGSYQDVDCSSYIPADAEGVILEIVNSAAAERSWGIRKNGSTDDFYLDVYNVTWCRIAIGVDASRIFEAKVESTSDITIYLVGYIPDGAGEFLTNATDVSTGTTGSYQDIDISGETSSTAKLAFFLHQNTDIYSEKKFALRQNGSTDDRYNDCLETNENVGACMSLDANEICEQKIEDTDEDLYLLGWIFDGYVDSNANATDVSTGTTGSWVDATLSGIDSGESFAFLHLYDTRGDAASIAYSAGVRLNGSSNDNYGDYPRTMYFPCETDADKKIEQKIENAYIDLYYFAWTKAGITELNASDSIALSEVSVGKDMSGHGDTLALADSSTGIGLLLTEAISLVDAVAGKGMSGHGDTLALADAVATNGLAISPPARIKVEVDSTEINYKEASLKITRNLKNRIAKAEFHLVSGVTPALLDEVLITGINTRYYKNIFGGYLKVLNDILIGVTREYDCKAQDWASRLKSIIVNKYYENQTEADIISDLFTTYWSDIGTSTYVTGPEVVNDIRFERISLFDALEQLAGVFNRDWFLDASKELHYFTAGADTSPVSIKDTGIDNVLSYLTSAFDMKDDATQIRNRVFVIGAATEVIHPAVVKFYDDSGSSYTDYTDEVTDEDEDTHMPLDAMQTADFVYIGANTRSKLIAILMGTNVNAIAAVLTVEYSQGSSSWGTAEAKINGVSTDNVYAPDSIQKYDAAAYSDIRANLVDDDLGTSENITSLDDSGDWLYVGDSDQFELMNFICAVTGTLYNCELEAQYSKGSGVWGDLDIADGTKGSSTRWDGVYGEWRTFWSTMDKPGNVTFEKPGDWATDTVNSIANKYWVRLKFNGTFDSGAVVKELKVATSSAGIVFGRSGDISVNLPLDWERDTVDGDDYYWLRLSVSIALSATVDVAGMTLTKQVFAKVIDTESYNAYSDYYDHKIVDASLKTDEVAEQAGLAFLEQYAMALKSGKLTLHAEGLEIGQQVPITNSLRGLSSSYVVEETIITIKGNTFHVDVKWGDYKPSLAQIIAELRRLKTEED